MSSAVTVLRFSLTSSSKIWFPHDDFQPWRSTLSGDTHNRLSSSTGNVHTASGWIRGRSNKPRRSGHRNQNREGSHLGYRKTGFVKGILITPGVSCSLIVASASRKYCHGEATPNRRSHRCSFCWRQRWCRNLNQLCKVCQYHETTSKFLLTAS